MIYELEKMKEKVMWGAVIWDLGALVDVEKMIPKGPTFLCDESMEYIALALNTSNRLGLDLSMVTSSSWNAGGPWMEHLSSSQIVEVPSEQKITIAQPKNEIADVFRYTLLILNSCINSYGRKEQDGKEEKAIIKSQYPEMIK